ncbi:MAG: murein L,D-transpeptidase family protein [Granulosicoccus sp.]
MSLPRWATSTLNGLILAMVTIPASARPHQALDSIDALDLQINTTLSYLSNGNIPQAQLLARQIAWRFPDFPLGQLIHAELESVSAFQDVRISDHLPMPPDVSELLLEAQRRLAAVETAIAIERPEQDSDQPLPGNVIQIGTNLSQLVIVDLQASVLFHYETSNQQAVLLRQHYVGSGEAGFGKRVEGDLKTPLGVYTITGFRSDASLPDLYGSGALTLDYPNAMDQYLGRTGYGIWLHGVPSNQLSRTPYSSEGCVTMSNDHLTRLAHELDASSTRVILTNDATPLQSDRRQTMQDEFRALFSQYQRAWITGDEKQLLGLYSDQDQLLELLASGNNGLMRVSSVRGKSARSPSQGLNHDLDHSWYQQAFAAIEPEQLNIFIHPDMTDNTLIPSDGVIVNATFGSLDEFQITTYWSRGLDGQWRILTESSEGAGL